MSPKRPFLFALLAIVVAHCAFAAPRTKSARLPKKHQEAIVQQVIPAYRLGDPAVLLQTLSPVVARLTEDQLTVANELLAEQEVPAVGELLADARLSLVQQNLIDRLPTPPRSELVITLGVLYNRIYETLVSNDRHPIMSDPLPTPDSIDGYKKIFWEAHVMDNELSNASRIAEYAALLAKLGARLNKKSLDEEQQKIVSTDYLKIVKDIARRRKEMEEREIELRIYRIEDAEEILAKADSRSRDRFLAAWAIGLDGNLVAEFFKERQKEDQPSYIRQDLSDPELPTKVEQLVSRATKVAGDLVQKTQLFYVGMHWWSRGRYGAGPNAWGLLKSPLALRSQQDQFPLFMPTVTPKPTDPVNQSLAQVPSVDRRHHYTWATEYRPITTSSSTSSKSTYNGSTTRDFSGTRRTTHMTNFY